MRITRTYLNASEDILRVDTIDMERQRPPLVDGVDAPTFYRRVRTEKIYSGTSYGMDRVVNTIEVVGDHDNIETASSNYLWANWEFGGTTVVCNMSDLPTVGIDV